MPGRGWGFLFHITFKPAPVPTYSWIPWAHCFHQRNRWVRSWFDKHFTLTFRRLTGGPRVVTKGPAIWVDSSKLQEVLPAPSFYYFCFVMQATTAVVFVPVFHSDLRSSEFKFLNCTYTNYGQCSRGRRGVCRIRETLLGIWGSRKFKKHYSIKHLSVALSNTNFILHYLKTLFQLHRLQYGLIRWEDVR